MSRKAAQGVLKACRGGEGKGNEWREGGGEKANVRVSISHCSVWWKGRGGRNEGDEIRKMERCHCVHRFEYNSLNVCVCCVCAYSCVVFCLC